MIRFESIEWLLLTVGVLLLASIISSKASGRLGVPALVLFLIIGMLAGSEGPGGIYFDDPWLAQVLGIVALIVILFGGGLDTDWQRVRPVLPHGIALATLGVVLTVGVVGLFAIFVIGLNPLLAFLLGAVVSSTDAAAVFTVLRARSTRLREPLEPLLELESGGNDPMAVFLTVSLIQLLSDPAPTWSSLLLTFVRQMALGGALGWLAGRAMSFTVNRIRLSFEGLYPVLTVSMMFLTYAITAVLGGSGFLAVYLGGLIMSKRDFVHRRSVIRFHDALSWLMQIVMFVTLGLLVFPSELWSIAGWGLLLAACLMLVARPVGVWISLAAARLPWRHKALVSWVGLRGAAPIILATFPRVAGIPGAELVFNLVFFAVITSVLIQGTSVPLVARWLHADMPATRQRRSPFELAPDGSFTGQLTEMPLLPESPAVGRQIVELRLPPGALVVLIGRDEEYIVPSGNTVLHPDDRLLLLGDDTTLAAVRGIIEPRPATT